MSELIDNIHEGILMEEKLVKTITAEIQELDDFRDLKKEKKAKILSLLTVLLEESEEHGKKLRAIADKY